MSNALPASVTINELTTVATEWALAQFTDETGQIIGAPSSNAAGFANAVNQAQANLADISSGGPASFWSNQGVTELSCTGGSPPVNCDGLERMDTIANILAACVESSGPSSTACSTLLSNTFSSTTTFTAAHIMATNPVANVAALFALQSGSSPFTPDLSAAPDGWEIALNFAPSGANFNISESVAIDAVGDAWVTNEGGNSVTELNSSGGLAGNFNSSNASGANFDEPDFVAIDAAGDAWVTNFTGSTVTELLAGCTTSSCTADNFNSSNASGANFSEPTGVAIDAAGNVWVTNEDNNSVSELLAGCTTSSCTADNFNNSNTIGANFSLPIGVAIDANGNAWVANSVGDSVTELNSSGGLVGNFAPSGANFKGPIGVAIDAGGNIWVPNAGNSVAEIVGAARPVLTPLVACLKQKTPHAVCLP
jgi:streptogramin lyase